MSKKKKQIRKTFRDEVFQRDKCSCRMCGAEFHSNTEEFLDAHHITDRTEMPNGGYVKENGISLCKDECHLKAEMQEEGYTPNELYLLIGSSFEDAVKASEKL